MFSSSSITYTVFLFLKKYLFLRPYHGDFAFYTFQPRPFGKLQNHNSFMHDEQGGNITCLPAIEYARTYACAKVTRLDKYFQFTLYHFGNNFVVGKKSTVAEPHSSRSRSNNVHYSPEMNCKITFPFQSLLV